MNCQFSKKFSENGIMRAIDVFQNYSEYELETQALGFRYLLQYGKFRPRLCPPNFKIERRINEIFNQKISTNLSDADFWFISELADICLEHFSNSGKNMLQILKTRQPMVQPPMPPLPNQAQFMPQLTQPPPPPLPLPVDKSVYNDKQNVHNSSINSSVKQVVIALCKDVERFAPHPEWEKIKEQVYLEMEPLGFITKSTLDEVFRRIDLDISTYGIDINLVQIFTSVWIWIHHHRDLNQLLQRLAEEMSEMAGFCSTGFMSRLINVIQGFSKKENLKIKLSIKDQSHAVVTHFLEKMIQEEKEIDLLQEMMDKSAIFVDFAREKLSFQIENAWREEYGEEFCDEIPKIAETYLGLQIFSLNLKES